MVETQIVVVGAGPHGLAAAAHLRRAGADVRVFGEPMSFWQTMSQGMLLRSNWTATSIADGVRRMVICLRLRLSLSLSMAMILALTVSPTLT